MHRLALVCLLLAIPALASAQRRPEHGPDKDMILESPVDPDTYVVGPGDRLQIDLWGLQEQSTEVEVSAEGRVFIPRVGGFAAQGQSLSALRKGIRDGLHLLYPNLKIHVSLVRPRAFMVHIAGAVTQPGLYPATGLLRASTLIPRASPLPNASARLIEVRRRDGGKKIVDLARITLLGEFQADPTLLDGDTIYVPLRQFDVEVSGAVRRPGRYELVAGRDIHELLELAGGVEQSASSELPYRHTTRGRGDRLEVHDIPQLQAERTVLHAGDAVHVPAIADLQRVVVVVGAIVGGSDAEEPERRSALAERVVGAHREASFRTPFVEGDGVRDLITKAGGLQPWADVASAYLLRPGQDGERRRIPVDVGAISAGHVREVPVQAGDTLIIPGQRESVVVGGAVQHPGLYPYNLNLHPLDYITFAGGATRTGLIGSARLVRRRGGTRRLRDTDVIEPGDIISVPESRVSAAEWVQLVLILTNLAVGTTALAITVRSH